MAKANPHVKVGITPTASVEKTGGNFMTMPVDEIVECKILCNAEEIVSVEQCALWQHYNPSPVWTYIGPTDPSHELGVNAGYRAFLPISYKKDGEVLVRLWSMSKTSHRRISEVSEMSGPLKGQIVRIKRTGAGLKTEHSIVPIGKRVKISESVPTIDDIIELLGPYDRDEIISYIEITTGESFAEVKSKVSVASKKASKDGKKGPGKKKVEVVELEDDDEDVEEAVEKDDWAADGVEELVEEDEDDIV